MPTALRLPFCFAYGRVKGMEVKYDSVTISGVTLSSSATVRFDNSQIPPGKTLGTYNVSATITLQRDGWQKLCKLLDGPRIRSTWDDKPAWMWPLFKAHEGGGNARQRRKRLRAAYREAMKLRAVEPAP